MYLQCQMPCGHIIVHYKPWKLDLILCSCGLAFDKPFAIETREWKVTCQASHCKYSRWFGQDRGGAISARNRHRESKGHRSTVDYLMNPELKKILNSAYGRSVRRWIMEGVQPNELSGIQRIAAERRGIESAGGFDEPPF